MPAKRLRIEDVQISITIKDEDTSPRSSWGGGITTRHSPESNAFVRRVGEMQNEYGTWGWCQVTVIAKLGPLCGHAYLGECSYSGKDGFKKDNYYQNMVLEALADLQSQVNELYTLITVASDGTELAL